MKKTIFVLWVIVVWLMSPMVGAATITVDDDGGADYTSLADAILHSVSGDTITVAAGTYSGPFSINWPLTITGAGRDVTTLTVSSGSGTGVIANNSPSGTVLLQNLFVTGGENGGITNEGNMQLVNVTVTRNRGSVGGINSAKGVLELQGVAVVDNEGTTTSGIFIDGEASVSKSLVAGNTGGNHGALYVTGSLSLSDSTVSGNRAQLVAGIFNQGAVTILRSTIVNNISEKAWGASGIVNYWYSSGSVSIGGSIVADNGFVDGSVADCSGNIVSQGYNIFGTACESGFVAGEGDQIGVEALLSELADNGGATQTHLPLAGSPALDAIPADPELSAGLCLPGQDQRAIDRPQGSGCEIGAVEVSVVPDEDGEADSPDDTAEADEEAEHPEDVVDDDETAEEDEDEDEVEDDWEDDVEGSEGGDVGSGNGGDVSGGMDKSDGMSSPNGDSSITGDDEEVATDESEDGAEIAPVAVAAVGGCSLMPVLGHQQGATSLGLAFGLFGFIVLRFIPVWVRKNR